MAFGPRGRVVGYTSVEREGDRLYNSLRVRRYDCESDLVAIVDRLAPDGLHVEEWLPKATFGGRVFDLRVVVIAGRPTHVLNVSALHQPNRHYLPGAADDSRDSHAAALEYVDSRMPRLFRLMTSHRRGVHAIMCSDHGTAYGEDGYSGHRVAHEVVWTVPYAEFLLRSGQW